MILTTLNSRPSLSFRRTTPDWSSGSWSRAVEAWSNKLSTKNTLPSGCRAVFTAAQNASNLSRGTCESQNPKKTASNAPAGGVQLNTSARTYSTQLDFTQV